jgi:multidrug resistance efflux pump
MKAIAKYLATGAVVLVAAGLVLFKYWNYVTNPWTRDGMVRAQVIQIAPRVSGPIVQLPIADIAGSRRASCCFRSTRVRFRRIST